MNDNSTFLLYGIMLTLMFGLIVGSTIFYAITASKADLVLANGLYVMNEGNGRYLVIGPQEGSGIMHSNIDLGLSPNVCYQIFLNATSHPLNIILNAVQTNAIHCVLP